MQKFHVKKGDEVVVIAGADKGQARQDHRGRSARNSGSIVEGVKMIKTHMRKSQQHPRARSSSAKASIHISNVMKAEKFDARAAKRGAAAPANA